MKRLSRPDSDAPPYTARPCRYAPRSSQGRKNLSETNRLGKLQSASSMIPAHLSLSRRRAKHQTPNPKLQRSSKSQVPNPKSGIAWQTARRPVFELGASCFFGAWSLEFGAFRLSQTRGVVAEFGAPPFVLARWWKCRDAPGTRPCPGLEPGSELDAASKEN